MRFVFEQVGNVVSVKNGLPKVLSGVSLPYGFSPPRQEKSKWDAGATSLFELHVQSEQAAISVVTGSEEFRLWNAAVSGPPENAAPVAVDTISAVEVSADRFYTLVGVVAAQSAVAEISTKNGASTQRLALTVYDSSEKSIEIVFWGADTRSVPEHLVPHESVVMITQVKSHSFRGNVSAVFGFQSMLYCKPNPKYTRCLLAWHIKNKKRASCLDWFSQTMKIPTDVTGPNSCLRPF